MDDHDVAVGLAGNVGGDGAKESASEEVDAVIFRKILQELTVLVSY